jgi:hypothetical protein
VIRPRPFLSLQSARHFLFEPVLLRTLLLISLPISLAIVPATPAVAKAIPATPQSRPDAISPADYLARLKSLDQLVATCQRATSPADCRSDQVGADIQIALPSGTRQIRFAWLRELLDHAAIDAVKKAPAKAPTTKADAARSQTASGDDDSDDAEPAKLPEYIPPTLAQRLEDARKHLAAESEAAAQIATQSAGQSFSKNPANPASSPQRQTLARILATREYHPAVAGSSLMSRLYEKIGNWIDQAISKLKRAGFQSRWIGLTAEITFVILFCVALVWFFIRLERQGHFGPALIGPGPGSDAASARDWQLWLEDARQAAAHGAWRDAIHLLYWASISRLESSGLWPADRARTPREYLALLSHESTQRPGLMALTRSFERTWYAGRPAAEADFRHAEQQAAQLGARSELRSREAQGTR